MTNWLLKNCCNFTRLIYKQIHILPDRKEKKAMDQLINISIILLFNTKKQISLQPVDVLWGNKQYVYWQEQFWLLVLLQITTINLFP